MKAEAHESRPTVAPLITGIKREKIIHAIANGESAISIAQANGHSNHTVAAIRDGEQHRITQVKSKLAKKFDRLCDRSINRAMKTVNEASYAQACVGAGISAQRSMELRGERQVDVGLTLNLLNLTANTGD